MDDPTRAATLMGTNTPTVDGEGEEVADVNLGWIASESGEKKNGCPNSLHSRHAIG